MIRLVNAETNADLGEITQAQLNVLIADMEEENAEDTDYYISVDTVDYLAQHGADAALITLLKNALGDRQDMDIRWVRS